MFKRFLTTLGILAGLLSPVYAAGTIPGISMTQQLDAPAAPLTTLTAAIGGWGAARILASPAGAASAARWTRTYSALRMAPSAQRLAAFEMASRNLANTAGVNVSTADFLKALQGPVPARAQDEQQ